MIDTKVKVMLGLFAFAALSLLVALFIIVGCRDLARNTVVNESESPNGKYTAIVFIRDAGATTGLSPQVSVIKSSHTLRNNPGNVFVCSGPNHIDIEWVDDLTLNIYYDCNEEGVFRKETKIYGITINYRRRIKE